MSIQEQQAKLMPKQDLSPYAGEWVTLVDGYVVAHSSQPEALRGLWGRRDVVVMPVPYPGLYV